MADFELEVTEEDVGQRIDVVLARRIPHLSRARAKALVEEGLAKVGGRVVRKSHLLASGDRVEVDVLPKATDFYAAPDADLPLEVLTETDDYVIVDK
ncbi:MAG: RluA family pseudouridine synthase, partial [Deltaproteobacteria bacterium]|nr:RluA family pseudouridine synthase [Deltaproteobacteria bacterium]